MLSDDDMTALQSDFGTLADKDTCTVRRGTKSSTTGVYGQPFSTVFTHTCTVLSLSQVKDAYIESFAKAFAQATKNPRVITMPLPFPAGKDVLRGDYIKVNSQDFQVLDTDNNSTYQFLRLLYCQWVEGSNV